jgi:transcriptional regulator with XRE-family HTH domain
VDSCSAARGFKLLGLEMETRTRSVRAEQADLSQVMRGSGCSWRQVADEFSRRWGLTYLQAFRLAHGWSQEEAAKHYNSTWSPERPLSGKHISYWEMWPSKSGKEPSLRRLSQLAEVYECTVSDLLRDLGSKKERPVPARHDDLDRRTGDSDRAVDHLFPLAPSSTMAGVQTEETDDSDLAAMRAFRTADLQVGGGQLYATVLSYLHAAVAPRLFGTAKADCGQSIFTAAGALTEMAGWMAHDAGRDGAAGEHFRRSLAFAAVGGDGQLAAHVMGSMSHLAVHQGDPGHAVRLACQGQEVLAKAPPNPALAARLLAMQARGLAAMPHPDAAACGQVLLQAEQTLASKPPDQPSPWISRFDEGSLASEAARSLRQLGQLQSAARHARRIIEIRPDSHARSRAFGQLLLANILISQGEPDEACAAGQEALAALQSLSSYLVVQELRRLAKRLEPYQASRVVAEYLMAVDDALHERLRVTPG